MEIYKLLLHEYQKTLPSSIESFRTEEMISIDDKAKEDTTSEKKDLEELDREDISISPQKRDPEKDMEEEKKASFETEKLWTIEEDPGLETIKTIPEHSRKSSINNESKKNTIDADGRHTREHTPEEKVIGEEIEESPPPPRSKSEMRDSPYHRRFIDKGKTRNIIRLNSVELESGNYSDIEIKELSKTQTFKRGIYSSDVSQSFDSSNPYSNQGIIHRPLNKSSRGSSRSIKVEDGSDRNISKSVEPRGRLPPLNTSHNDYSDMGGKSKIRQTMSLRGSRRNSPFSRSPFRSLAGSPMGGATYSFEPTPKLESLAANTYITPESGGFNDSVDLNTSIDQSPPPELNRNGTIYSYIYM